MLYRYKATPKSPFMTEIMSDTLFGHLCWAIAYTEGDKFLEEFLTRYEENKPAPILFSSAFPAGRLPRPTLPALTRKKSNTLMGKDRKNIVKNVSKLKDLSKKKFIAIDDWKTLKNDYSQQKFYEMHLKRQDTDETCFNIETGAANAISRINGRTLEDGGFFTREKRWHNEDTTLDIYMQADESEYDRAHWFLTDYLPQNGFGADKSIGMGHMTIEQDKDFDPSFFEVNEPNARMSLCLAAFEGIGSIDASYKLNTKFGKLGGSFAFSSPTGGNPKPFKKPILMYEPGAIFFCKDELNDRPLLNQVHSEPTANIRHCGIPITLPLKMTTSEVYP